MDLAADAARTGRDRQSAPPWRLTDLISVETLQSIQDTFARAFGLPTVIIDTGGRYWFTGGLNWRATGPWLLGASVGLLFTNTAWFVGPGTDLTDGTDTGFFVAGVIVAILYPIVLRLFPEPRELFPPDETPASGDAFLAGTPEEELERA